MYRFECKVVESSPDGRAMQQLLDLGYADQYRALGQPIHLISMEFSKEACSEVKFEVLTLGG